MEADGAKARALLVAAADGEAFAVVEGAADARLLHARRLRGAPEGGERLRLALEELAVGLVHGLLALAPAVGGEEQAAAARRLERELRDAVARGGDGVALSRERRDRIRVFADLWERGYVVTFGSKFGADFLIYRDDPERSHALALIIVKKFEEQFSRVDIASHGRVTKMVKKQLYYVSVKPQALDSAERRTQLAFVSLTHALLASRQSGEVEANNM